jgi:fatty acid desaturase
VSSVPLPAASRQLPPPARPPRAINEAIRTIPIEWFRPSPAIYWMDLIGSAAVGWTGFVLAVGERGWHRAALLLIAVFALYRALLFIHEITHLARRDLPGFTLAWNALVGVPLLVPSFLYAGVHTDHHRQRSYGTNADPEYVPFGRRPALLMAGYILASLFAPAFFVLRFALLAPLSWAISPLRRLVTERGSALVINHHYIRRAAVKASGRVQEVAAFAVCWASVGLWWLGALPAAAFVCWAVVVAVVSGVNAARTLAAHRYDRDEGELTMTEQLLDSCTIAPAERPSSQLCARVAGAARALVAPVGLRYHSLHHWIPSLPYHNLGRAHRLLFAALAPDAPYGTTVERGFTPLLRDLLRRSRAPSRS